MLNLFQHPSVLSPEINSGLRLVYNKKGRDSHRDLLLYILTMKNAQF